jgi:pyrimidine operon attenuation protein / uracil phosphoribosyltransferase
MHTLLDAAQISQLLAAIADEIAADPTLGLKPPADAAATATAGGGVGGVALIGIRSRGELLAERIAVHLRQRTPDQKIDVGALDITMYRDDLASRRAITIPQGTDMNFQLDDRPVVLVDDVLETGRSVRAALDALVDYGRPRLIHLAVLIDRGRREFPIAADYVGLHVTETATNQKIRVKLKPTDPDDGVYLVEDDS